MNRCCCCIGFCNCLVIHPLIYHMYHEKKSLFSKSFVHCRWFGCIPVLRMLAGLKALPGCAYRLESRKCRFSLFKNNCLPNAQYFCDIFCRPILNFFFVYILPCFGFLPSSETKHPCHINTNHNIFLSCTTRINPVP
jgi:hypothetical protein